MAAVTLDSLIAEAKTISQRFRAWRKQHPGDDECADLLTELRASNKEFSQSYPIVMRYMAMGEFSETAFRRYIGWITVRGKKLTTEMSAIPDPAARMEALEVANLELQAEYAVFLYRETHAHYTATAISNLRTNITHMLYAEYRQFKDALKHAQGRVDELEKLLDIKRREETAEYARRVGAIDPNRVVVETDCVASTSQVADSYIVNPPQSADDFLV